MVSGWRSWWSARQKYQVTLLGKCVALIAGEVLVNAVLWLAAGIVFNRVGANQGRRALSLALVAWTTGLRHGLDADHISAIDNATRRIVSVPRVVKGHDGTETVHIRRPVTVGLFFSLGHSTVVFATTVAIAISADVANRLDGFGEVGGIIGASISSSFLILIGFINSFILYKTWKRLQKAKRTRELEAAGSPDAENTSKEEHHFNGFITRLAMPILRAVDRPWKMYPVGLLFGLGFDTASSIALLSVAVIAMQDSDGQSNSNAKVILFSLLFTAGMTLVDSLDSCLMIWAYAPDTDLGSGRWRWLRVVRRRSLPERTSDEDIEGDAFDRKSEGDKQVSAHKKDDRPASIEAAPEHDKEDEDVDKHRPLSPADPQSPPPNHAFDPSSLDVSASRISLVLTLLSIFVAFAIGIIVLLGLIGDECHRCTVAADKQEETQDGGLEGRWWLAWRRANDNSGYVGAAIVATFLVCVLGYYGSVWVVRHMRKNERTADEASNEEQ